MATSLVLSVSALLLLTVMWVAVRLADMWVADWLADVPFDILVLVSYFAVIPGLALLGVIFAGRDVCRKGHRLQAAAAFCLGAGLLAWFWKGPSH